MAFNQPLAGRIEPVRSPTWARASAADRLAFYTHAGELAKAALRAQLGRGVGAAGRAMKPRKHPRADGADGPVMTPHDAASRARRLLAARATAGGVTLYWHSGHSKAQKLPFGTILGYHARGEVRGAPIRDVRLSDRNVGILRAKLAAWWDDRHPARRTPTGAPRPAPRRRAPAAAPALTPAQHARIHALPRNARPLPYRDIGPPTAPPAVPPPPPPPPPPAPARPARPRPRPVVPRPVVPRPIVPAAPPTPPAPPPVLAGARPPVPRPARPAPPPIAPRPRIAPAPVAPPPPPPAPTKFDRSKAAVRIDPAERSDIDRRSVALFGRVLDERDWASLAGAPDHATVRVSTAAVFDTTTVSISWQTAEAAAHRSIEKRPQGTVIHNQTFFVAPGKQGNGFGLDVFGRQVEQGRELGAVAIHTHAARSSTMNGYYTWPRFGYDAPIPPQLQSRAGVEFPGAKRVSDLMTTQKGRDWWKIHGSDLYSAEFDLADQSQSNRAWEAYLIERKAKAKAPARP